MVFDTSACCFFDCFPAYLYYLDSQDEQTHRPPDAYYSSTFLLIPPLLLPCNLAFAVKILNFSIPFRPPNFFPPLVQCNEHVALTYVFDTDRLSLSLRFKLLFSPIALGRGYAEICALMIFFVLSFPSSSIFAGLLGQTPFPALLQYGEAYAPSARF